VPREARVRVRVRVRVRALCIVKRLVVLEVRGS
jgi:hypothetical protein